MGIIRYLGESNTEGWEASKGGKHIIVRKPIKVLMKVGNIIFIAYSQ